MKTGPTLPAEPLAARVALHPFLAGMNRTQLVLLTDCAMAVRFQKGETILHEGGPANRLYLIERGKITLEAKVSSDQSVIIETLGPGDLLGWSCLFPPYVWHFTARAIEPAEAIFFYGSMVREYCGRDQSLGYELLKRVAGVMIKRLQAAREKMLAVRTGKNAALPIVQSPFADHDHHTSSSGNGATKWRNAG